MVFDDSRQRIEATRAANRERQRSLLARRGQLPKRPPAPSAIGSRSEITGQHEAVYPDGSNNPNGQKLSSGVTKPGESAVSYPKRSGAVGLDTPSPKERDTQPLRDKCVGYLKGQIFNCEEEQVEPPGNIKYLFSVDQGGSRLFYAGGWRRESVLVKTLTGAFVFHASIDNLGGDRFGVNLGYTIGDTHIVEYLTESGPSWALTVPGAPDCHGHGFWTILQYLDDAALKRFKVFQGVLATAAQNPRTDTGTPEPPDYYYAYTDNKIVWLLPTIEQTNSGGGTTYGTAGGTGTAGGSDYGDFYSSPYRISPTGDQAVGYRATVVAAAERRYVDGVLISETASGAVGRYTYWIDRQSGKSTKQYATAPVIVYPGPDPGDDTFRGDNPYIDVQRQTFTSIAPDSLTNITAEDQRAKVQLYNSRFAKAGFREILAYKVDRTGDNYTFYNASVKLPGVK